MSPRPDSDDPAHDDDEYEEYEYVEGELEEGEEYADDDFLEDDEEYEYEYEEDDEEEVEETVEEEMVGTGILGAMIDEEGPEVSGAPGAAETTGDPPSRLSSLFSSLSRGDTIWLASLALVFLILIIGGLSMFFKNVETSSTPGKVDFPIEGQFAVIEEIETFWRKPDRSRDSDRGVKLDAKLIPGGVITLDPGSSAGALRIFFEDPRGELVGDPVTHAFSDGKFRTGENKMELNSTGGFNDEGEYAAYLTEEVHFWHLVVKEGPGPNAAGYEFKELLRLRISHKRL